ncbi:MAG: AraC family transcriptional regulator [Comamonadaceae bacterium]|nr:AraC family transcriptional regulator [Comamonadaceae bacterium]
MLSPPSSIPIVFVHSMLAGLAAAKQPTQEWLAAAGIAPALLDHPSARVTADQYARLLRVLMERSGDEALGFLSRPLRPGTLALLARSTLGAGTLGVALRRLVRAFGLVQDDLCMDLLHEGSLSAVALRPANPTAAYPVFLYELMLRVFWRLLAWLAGGRLPVHRFDFAFPRPPHASSYAQLFPGNVVFDQPCCAFWFDSRRLQTPVRRDEAALRSFLAEAQTQIIIPRRGEGSLPARVRAHLLREQPHWPSLASCAAALNMAVSTLQRRLAEEHTSFRAVKDSLRRDMAIARLNSSQVPLAVLAGELGFSDSAAFQRAFKGWTGAPPGSYRHPGQG